MSQLPGVFAFRIPYSVIGNNVIDSVGTIVKQFGSKKVLIVTDPGIVEAGLLDKVKQPLAKEGIEFGVFDGGKPNAPFSVIKSVAQLAKDGGYDLLIGLGGGSAMDIAKMASLVATAKDVAQEDINDYFEDKGRHGLPTLLIVTTAGTGSEWTMCSVITDDEGDGEKRAALYPALIAQAVIVDPLLTLNLPPRATADTGVDAFCHAVECFTGNSGNVVGEMFQKTAIELIANNLRAACGKGSNIEARYYMSVAAMMATLPMAFTGGANLVHGLGHSLQMIAKCTHGVSCGVVLPYVLDFNMLTTMPKLACLAELMGEHVAGLSQLDAAKKSLEAVRRLLSDVGLPLRLRDIGLKKEDFPHIIDNLFNINMWAVDSNPRDCTREDVAGILEAAW